MGKKRRNDLKILSNQLAENKSTRSEEGMVKNKLLENPKEWKQEEPEFFLGSHIHKGPGRMQRSKLYFLMFWIAFIAWYFVIAMKFVPYAFE